MGRNDVVFGFGEKEFNRVAMSRPFLNLIGEQTNENTSRSERKSTVRIPHKLCIGYGILCTYEVHGDETKTFPKTIKPYLGEHTGTQDTDWRTAVEPYMFVSV